MLARHNSTSHQVWEKNASTFVLATHGKDLKLYQLKEALIALETKNESKKNDQIEE